MIIEQKKELKPGDVITAGGKAMRVVEVLAGGSCVLDDVQPEEEQQAEDAQATEAEVKTAAKKKAAKE